MNYFITFYKYLKLPVKHNNIYVYIYIYIVLSNKYVTV